MRKNIRKDRKSNEERILEIMETTASTRLINKKLSEGKQWIPNLNNKELKYAWEDILKIATDYFSKLSTAIPLKIYKTRRKTYNIPPFLREEIEKEIKNLKYNKSPGDDNIVNEIIKIGIEERTEPIQTLFNNILSKGQIPHQWKKSQIILIFKKGDRSNMSSYRPISFIPAIRKIFTKLLQRRLKTKLEEFQSEDQAGFRKNKSTVDHLHAVNQIIEKTTEYNIPVYMCFVDYYKAFNSLEHSRIWTSLQKANIENEFIWLMKQ